MLRYQPGHPAVPAGSLPVPVANAAAGVLGGTAYLVGGDDGQRPVPTVTEFRLVNPAAAIPQTTPGGPLDARSARQPAQRAAGGSGPGPGHTGSGGPAPARPGAGLGSGRRYRAGQRARGSARPTAGATWRRTPIRPPCRVTS